MLEKRVVRHPEQIDLARVLIAPPAPVQCSDRLALGDGKEAVPGAERVILSALERAECGQPVSRIRCVLDYVSASIKSSIRAASRSTRQVLMTLA